MASRTATLSTIIEPSVKQALNRYCKRKGLKLRYVVEEALIERLEDEIDLEAFRRRRNEETFSLDEVLTSRK